MVNVLCYKSKTLSNGEHPLVIRVCKDGKKKYQNIGISVKPEYWDFTKNLPKRNCPNKEQIQQLILEKTKVYNEQILEYKIENKEFTAKRLVDKVTGTVNLRTVNGFFETVIKRLVKQERLNYSLSFMQLKNSLLSYNKHLDIYFSDIDISWLKQYECWLRGNNLKENTIGIRFRTLRALYNVAIDLFTFSYFTAGINFVDMAQLTKDNLKDNRIVYVRKKTKKLINVPLQSKAIELINKYVKLDNPYLFPVLSPFHKTEQQKAYPIGAIHVFYKPFLFSR
jgi:hypothetical protein